MSWLSRLTERRILKSLAEGKLRGLEGEGHPLPDRSGEAHLDPGEAMGFRIMAEAGALPEEITLKKQVAAQQQVLAGLTDPEARKAAMARLAELQMKQSMAEEARRRFLRD
ncbi:DUF1992 domain-containing protein [Alloyangia pacifica]|uniref:DnaJ family domain-containing protein n=1 Tax=Alloyangia pacifica TaxID=311180 RepID=UPI001CFED016|nr:DUF1992 domain-containing protein [Alloyangia pacifica]